VAAERSPASSAPAPSAPAAAYATAYLAQPVPAAQAITPAGAYRQLGQIPSSYQAEKQEFPDFR
jgi:hypothetical protein